jgi:sensor histidine kinase regulating citrate/malate metabolism
LIDAFNSATGSDVSDTVAFDQTTGEEMVKSTTTVFATATMDSGFGTSPGQPRIADKLNSFLNIPLISDGNMVGMVHVGSHRDEVFTPDVISLVYAVVSQLPSAIQRLEKIKSMERERTLKLAEIVSEGVIMIDENLQVAVVNRAAQNVLGIGIEDLDLQMIQDILGANLAGLKKQSENGALDLVVKEKSIESERYEVKTSVIRREDGTFLGFVISMRRSPETRG